MTTRIAAAAAALLFVLGAVVQIWSPRLGLTLMLLGILAAVASVLFLQRAIQKRLMKHERFLVKLQQSVTTGTKKVERLVTAGNATASKHSASLERQVKLLAERPGAPTVPAAQPAASASSPPSRTGIGRASTPDVTNPFTDESLHSMLAPNRAQKIAGIFTTDHLPDHEPSQWIPGDVVSSLERSTPDLIVVDEGAIRDSAVWSSAYSAVGTALMRELLDGLTWAQDHRVPVYLLPSTLSPDVHSSALRGSSAVLLPLDTEALDAAAGAPQTPLFQSLQELAAARTEGAA
ncbi:hypothetical protein ACT3TE_09550 [Brachybacterium sp. AOP42-B2-9]|uniref:hypothetical protein n=1 Tax=Brachybacterium sp. AOP42-B2-9 TaxID=3457672 RepID=UPI004034C0E0